jgi:hypothetical protein
MMNSGWGYDRIVGALANLGHPLSDQTVGNILRRHDIAPAPKRSQTTTWQDFIRRHMDVLAGTDFFTAGDARRDRPASAGLLDALLPHKAALEKHLKEKLGEHAAGL